MKKISINILCIFHENEIRKDFLSVINDLISAFKIEIYSLSDEKEKIAALKEKLSEEVSYIQINSVEELRTNFMIAEDTAKASKAYGVYKGDKWLEIKDYLFYEF